MDLAAYMIMNIKPVNNYVEKHYGEIPRPRGIRFMAIEDATDGEFPLFDSYCGKDVVCIHTRCGDCGYSFDDEDTNYIAYGADKWEESHKDLFLEHQSDDFDPTYCDHYFTAIVNDEYKKILKQLTGMRE